MKARLTHFEILYKIQHRKPWNLSTNEAMTIIEDAGKLSDNGILRLLSLHSRMNDHEVGVFA